MSWRQCRVTLAVKENGPWRRPRLSAAYLLPGWPLPVPVFSNAKSLFSICRTWSTKDGHWRWDQMKPPIEWWRTPTSWPSCDRPDGIGRLSKICPLPTQLLVRSQLSSWPTEPLDDSISVFLDFFIALASSKGSICWLSTCVCWLEKPSRLVRQQSRPRLQSTFQVSNSFPSRIAVSILTCQLSITWTPRIEVVQSPRTKSLQICPMLLPRTIESFFPSYVFVSPTTSSGRFSN